MAKEDLQRLYDYLEYLDYNKGREIASRIKCFDHVLSSYTNKKTMILASLCGRLKKTQKAYRGWGDLRNTIEQLEADKATYKKLKTHNKKEIRPLYDKNIEKPDKKQNYWNELTLKVVPLINEYCHGPNCAKLCKIDHGKASQVAAVIFKLMYPGIWTEDEEKIFSQIKSKRQRGY